ncbi:ATP-binding cassette domain-containing protein [Streptomyces sp. NPDC058872]|uniref:ATP-binding cassette domain-containing protein n=1 Tax=Streptomyces sp. NPDC058872 TaxID=3346661 RepID=UPI00368BCF06
MGAEAGKQPHGAAVVADGFGLKGPRGWVFRDVSFRAGAGSLVAVEGPSGSGRTCLLLALTGRMRAKEGRAEIGGFPLPRKMAAVRRISALGQVPGVSELDPALTVGEHLHERALLQRRYDGSVRAFLQRPAERAAAARARIEEALEAAGLDLDALPKGTRTSVRDLERLEALRLTIALALIGRPRLLAVDDTDLKLSDAERTEVWALLRSVAGAGTTVLAVCAEAPADALRVTTVAGSARNTAEAESAQEVAEAESAGGTAGGTRTAGGAADAGRPAPTAPPAPAEETGGTRPARGNGTDGAAPSPAGEEHDDDTEEGAADALAETGRA